jgi:hypothetical protein
MAAGSDCVFVSMEARIGFGVPPSTDDIGEVAGVCVCVVAVLTRRRRQTTTTTSTTVVEQRSLTLCEWARCALLLALLRDSLGERQSRRHA